MSDFISQNIERRRQAKTEQESSFAKLLSNSAFGRMAHSPRKRMIASLVTNKKQLETALKKTSLSRYISFGEEFGLAVFHPRVFTPRNPVYISCVILSVSKYLMGRWYFKIWKPTFWLVGGAITTGLYEGNLTQSTCQVTSHSRHAQVMVVSVSLITLFILFPRRYRLAAVLAHVCGTKNDRRRKTKMQPATTSFVSLLQSFTCRDQHLRFT